MNTPKSKLSQEHIYWGIGAVAIALCFTSYYLGYGLSSRHFNEYLRDFKPLRKADARYQYISPLVGTDSPNAFDVGYHKDVEKTIREVGNQFSKKGLTGYAIYYRELNSAVWFGINEDEEFYPASLLKITVALATYKEAEDRTGYLDSKLTFTQEIKDLAKGRANLETDLVAGNAYTVKDLIQLMIINSDNGARDLLADALDIKYINQLYDYLNIDQPSATTDFSISMADYALFFRMLYSATYINEDHSEELLNLLTQTKFPFGIVRDIPPGIPVAHKFGVFNIPKNENGIEIQELHECGIVYQLDKPYLVCVMTKGTTQSVLADFIGTISKKIYDYSLSEQ